MKILIAADMEGITGVTNWDQVEPSHPEYERFRKLMTRDVNAAILGAYAGGARSMSVTDGHHYGTNILIEELDPQAVLHSGGQLPLSMVHGVDQGVDGVLFIGYHARAGAQSAILDHTWSDGRVANLWINDRLFGETGLNGAVCGNFDVPVIMISGDQTVCAEAKDFFGNVETAVVKKATNRMAAECLPPQATQILIQKAAERAVRRLDKKQAPAPFKVQSPIQMVIEFTHSEMSDQAAMMQGANRVGDRKVAYVADEMAAIYAAFQTLVALAR